MSSYTPERAKWAERLEAWRQELLSERNEYDWALNSLERQMLNETIASLTELAGHVRGKATT